MATAKIIQDNFIKAFTINLIIYVGSLHKEKVD